MDKLIVSLSGVLLLLIGSVIFALTHPAAFLMTVQVLGLLLACVIAYILWHHHHMANERRKMKNAEREQVEAEARRQHAIAKQEEYKFVLIQQEVARLQLQQRIVPQVLQAGGSVEWTQNALKITAPTRIVESIASPVVVTQSQIAAPYTARPLELPGKTLMIDVMRHWNLTLDNLFLAYGKGREEIACSLDGFMHVAHDAPTGQGKTVQTRAEMIMLLKLGVYTLFANPHFAPVGKKGEDWRPIARAIEAQGLIELAPGVRVPGLIQDYAMIAQMLAWFATSEIDRRFKLQRQGNYSYAPVYLFIDEWPAIQRRHPEASDALVDVLQRGRAVEVCVDTNAQGFLQSDVNLGGSARENFNTAYHMGGSVHSGSKLLDMPIKEMNALFKEEQVALGKGVAMLRNNQSCPQAQLVRLPYADNDYVYYMLGRADEWIMPEFRTSGTYREQTENVPIHMTGPLVPEYAQERLTDTLEHSFPSVPDVPTGTQRERAMVTAEERERIKALAYKKVPRREMCGRLGKGKRYYEVVRQVLDEEGL